MRGRLFGARRNVLPIGQEMGGDEIDVLTYFAVTQPEFPDIGIGHRHIHARLDRADDLPQVGDGHLSPQQHFAADDNGRDRAGMILHQRDRDVGELGVLSRDRVRSRRRAEPSIRPWTQARAPCRARCRSNRCGCIWRPWPVRPGPPRSAPDGRSASDHAASDRCGTAHTKRTPASPHHRSARASAPPAWRATTTPRQRCPAIRRKAPAACESRSSCSPNR